MSITNLSGPLIVSLADPYNPDSNPEQGPSLSIEGFGILDPRPFFTYKSGQDFGQQTCGFLGSSNIMTLNITPATKSASAIAAAQHVTDGTPMTLVSSSGSGIVVGASAINPNSGATITGLLAVGQAAARVSFGSVGTIQLWDPTTLTARVVIITCNNSSGTGGNITIAGYDIYGFPMTETLDIAPGSALTVTGQKAWKYIASITPAFTDGTYTYEVGTTDIFGFPLASNYFGDLLINYPSAVVTADTGYTAGVNTLASATTGDVRGTYALQTASNGTNQLILYQNILLPNLALPNGVAGSSTGMFGVNQF